MSVRAVLFDAGNTLLHLDYARLERHLSPGLGLAWTEGTLAGHAPTAFAAMQRGGRNDRERAERYLELLLTGAGVPPARLPEAFAIVRALHEERHLWSVLDPDAPALLERLREGGLRLGVVSNSDGRVTEALSAAGLADAFEVVVDSAVVGFEKPDPRIFAPALDHLGVPAGQVAYVGDRYEVDVVGAGRAGLLPILLRPPGAPPPGRPCRTVPALSAVAGLVLGPSATLT